jgi:hypothetical protein
MRLQASMQGASYRFHRQIGSIELDYSAGLPRASLASTGGRLPVCRGELNKRKAASWVS